MTSIIIFDVFVILLKCTLGSGHDMFCLWTWCHNGDIVINWGTVFFLLKDCDVWNDVWSIFLWESLRILMEWSSQLIRFISCIVQLYFLARKIPSNAQIGWISNVFINVMRNICVVNIYYEWWGDEMGIDLFVWMLCRYCICLHVEFDG